MFVLLVCILRDDFDASFHCEQIGNPCLLDDAYLYWGCTWGFHPCHLHDLYILHDVIAILHGTFHNGGVCMMLMMLKRMHTGQWDPDILRDVKFSPLTLLHGYLQLRKCDP